MTPKEKAKEIFDKFILIRQDSHDNFITYELAKQCALIAVDEILDLDSGDAVNKDFWEDVKQEIEKL